MNVIDFNDYKFRCSQLGKLMVGLSFGLTEKQSELLEKLESKEKLTDKQKLTLADLIRKRDNKPKLSSGVKTHLQDIHKSTFFNRSDKISNKYLDKGIQAEEKAITLYSKIKGSYFEKNKERFYNDFIQGEPDSKIGIITDIKNSWNFKTFPLHKEEIPTKDYWWQLQGYMWLTGLKQAELAYCLVDTPQFFVADELRRLDWKHDTTDFSGAIRKEAIPLVVETVSNLIYTEDGLKSYLHQSVDLKEEWFSDFKAIPDEFRVKIFKVDYDDKAIETLKKQIAICREYLNEMTIKMTV